EWVFLYQYANEANPRAHYEGTGPEIWRDCPEITHFVAGLGTSGTLMGVGRYLKEQNPDVKVVAIEPPLGERVEGLRNLDEGYIPPVYDKWGGQHLLDRKGIVRPRESIEWTRRLVDVGVFSGISGGAALAGAAKVAGEIERGTIVVILADGGWKYLSTGAWTGDIDEVAALAERLIVFWRREGPHRDRAGHADPGGRRRALPRLRRRARGPGLRLAVAQRAPHRAGPRPPHRPGGGGGAHAEAQARHERPRAARPQPRGGGQGAGQPRPAVGRPAATGGRPRRPGAGRAPCLRRRPA